MPDRNGAFSPEIALDRYLDAVAAGLATAPDEHLDPGLAATVQRVHALDVTPQPHPTFASSLWEDLMSVQSLSRTVSPQPRLPLPIRPTPITGWRIGSARPPSLSRFAAAIVLVLLLIGSAFAALFPLRQRDGEGLPLFAPLATPTAESESANGILLVDLTLTDIPGFPNEGGMAVTDYPPGGGSIELAGKESPEVFYIANGPMTMRVEEAVDPVRVIPPREARSAETERLLAAGQETILATGTTVVSPERAVVELRNDEAVPTKMIDLLWATESYSTESGLATWKRGTGMKPQDLVFPVSVVLRQLTLAPEGILPAPASADTVQAVAPLNPTQRFDLIYRGDDSILNKGTQPVDLYHLTVTNNAEAITPSRSIATPDSAVELEFVWKSTGEAAVLKGAYGLGIDPAGNVWVAEGNTDRFQIIAPDGTYRETWGTPGSGEGQFEFLSSESAYGRAYGDIAFDADGNFYVADTGNFRVQKFAPDRTFLQAWGSKGKATGSFWRRAVSPSERMAWSMSVMSPAPMCRCSPPRGSIWARLPARGRRMASSAPPAASPLTRRAISGWPIGAISRFITSRPRETGWPPGGTPAPARGR